MITKDINGNIIDEYDLAAGYLTEEYENLHHEAVAEVLEEGHWETIAEYKNGGKDVKWVVDVKGVTARDAYDERVPYRVYTPYTPEELAEIRANMPTVDERLADLQAQIDLILSGVTE